MSRVVETLKAARELIAAGRWTQGDYKKKVGGVECFCALGAVMEVAGRDHGDNTAPLYKALGNQSVVSFNDTPGRTAEEVIALFDKAIAAEEAKALA